MSKKEVEKILIADSCFSKGQEDFSVLLGFSDFFLFISKGIRKKKVELDSQEIHTTNINPSYKSSISHPMLKEWSNYLG